MMITERWSLCDLVLTDFLQMLAPYRYIMTLLEVPSLGLRCQSDAEWLIRDIIQTLSRHQFNSAVQREPDLILTSTLSDRCHLADISPPTLSFLSLSVSLYAWDDFPKAEVSQKALLSSSCSATVVSSGGDWLCSAGWTRGRGAGPWPAWDENMRQVQES